MQTQEVALVTCPQCQGRYEAPVTPIVDVGEEPNLKVAFLRGQINSGQCPQCSATSEFQTPVLYHDASKALALIFAPTNLSMSNDESQRIIGNLTNRLMNSLPTEQRKAYLLTPQTFLTMDSLRKAILEADGITEEMMQAQAAKIQLLQEMMRIQDETALKTLVETKDAELDQQFFEVLSSMAFEALSTGEQERAQGLLGFRQMIAEWSSQGLEYIAKIDEQAGFQLMNSETLLEALKNADSDEAFMDLIQRGKGLIDYTFFQNLTNQIDLLEAAGNTAEAETFKALRSRILDTSAKIEEESRQFISRVTKLIDNLVKSPDPNTFITENLPEFDEDFFAVLGANIQEAANQGQNDAAEKLGALYNQIMSVIQANIPPELKLLNDLLQLSSPDLIKSTLEQNRTTITPQFLALLDHARTDFESQGRPEMMAILDKIKEEANIAKQGGIILTP